MNDDAIRRICAMLHERGREVTPAEVAAWLADIKERYRKIGRDVEGHQITTSLLKGHKVLTACLHLRFGDAL